MDLIQLIYASQPFGYDSAMLGGILLDARRCNERDGITGALVCRHDIYLQLLEGPEDRVSATYSRICHDDRHTAVKRLVSRTVADRMFGAWAMLHDPEKSVIWTMMEISDGVLERSPQTDVIGMFETISSNAEPKGYN